MELADRLLKGDYSYVVTTHTDKNQYKDNAPFMQQYNNTRNKEAYFMQHEEQLTLYDGAKNKLQEYGIKPHISALQQVDKDITELEMKERSLELKYDTVRKEAKDLEQKEKNIIQYLGIEEIDTPLKENLRSKTSQNIRE